MNTRKELIKKLFKLLREKNISVYDKELFIKILNLIKEYTKEDYISLLEKEILSIDFNDENSIKEEVMIFKIKSIISDFESKSYIKKIVYKDFTAYYYIDNIDIYIKTMNNMDEIFKLINESLNDSILLDLIIMYNKKDETEKFFPKPTKLPIDIKNYKENIINLLNDNINNSNIRTILIKIKI